MRAAAGCGEGGLVKHIAAGLAATIAGLAVRLALARGAGMPEMGGKGP